MKGSGLFFHATYATYSHGAYIFIYKHVYGSVQENYMFSKIDLFVFTAANHPTTIKLSEEYPFLMITPCAW